MTVTAAAVVWVMSTGLPEIATVAVTVVLLPSSVSVTVHLETRPKTLLHSVKLPAAFLGATVTGSSADCDLSCKLACRPNF